MTEDFISFVQWFFASSWAFFEGVTVPGLTISFADFFIGMAMVGFLLKFLSFVFGFTLGPGLGRADRSGKRVRINSQRAKDER